MTIYSIDAVMFADLSEPTRPVGGVYASSREPEEWYVPVICGGQRFLMIFARLRSEDSADMIANIIWTETGHRVSQNACTIKYAAADVYAANQFFAPLDVQLPVRDLIRRAMPGRLVAGLKTFLHYQLDADEIYFMAGATDDYRLHKLNLWYHRLGGKIAPQLGFTPVHLSRGEWHGYRKNYS